MFDFDFVLFVNFNFMNLQNLEIKNMRHLIRRVLFSRKRDYYILFYLQTHFFKAFYLYLKIISNLFFFPFRPLKTFC
jgi:hypothetical protein